MLPTQNSHTNDVLQAPVEDINSNNESFVKTEKLSTSKRDSKNTSETNKKANNSSDVPQTSKAVGLIKNDDSLIKQVSNRQEFDNLIETTKEKYILVWFSANWCGPCKELAIKLHELSRKYRNKIEIFKVDVDDLADLALENEVSIMPAYMIMRNGQKLSQYIGTKQEQIDELVKKYLTE